MKIDQEASLISVYGVGKIKIQPNVIRIVIGVSHISKTIKESQIEVNKRVHTLLDVFNELKIENIQTTAIKFHPEYEYREHKRVLLGQKVEQSIVVVIHDLENNLDTAKELLDKISIDLETMNCSVNFGIDNYEEKAVEARTLAYRDAYEKAQQYAKQANLKITKTIKISEFEPTNDGYLRGGGYDGGVMVCESPPPGSGSSTKIQLGEMDIERELYCDFLAQ